MPGDTTIATPVTDHPKTQAKTLAHLLGDDAEEWKGQTIILAPTVAPNRKATIALSAAADRSIPAQPDQPAPAAPAAVDDEQDPDPIE